ncbi:MAG: GIY-YIG nuclease family protein [Balneola sp.]
MLKSYIHNIHNGVDTAYIYIWLSKKHKLVYVGMTNSFAGSIGRANGHFNRRGTLRKRFQQYKGYGIEKVDDLILLSFPLPKKKKYTTVETSYREAIEVIVQKELLKIRGTFNPTFDVISWVRDSSRTNNFEVKKLATQIVTLFKTGYNGF